MYKLLFAIFFICFSVFSTVGANERISEGADLLAVRNLAVASPLYTQVKDAPGIDEVTDTIFQAGKISKKHVFSYNEIIENIMNDAKINLKSLDRRQAFKIYREHISNYADAYVVVTVANNSRIVFFFDVFKADTHELLYAYEVAAGKKDANTLEVYQRLSADFYRAFDRATEKQERELAK